MVGVSFIIPVYNTDIRYLKNCFTSLIKECSSEDEIIIINDGSKKVISSFINRYKKKIRIINNKYHVGISYSRNIGILKAKKEFISFVDSDDYVKKNSLKRIKKGINNKRADIYATNFNFISNNRTVSYKKREFKRETVWGYFFKKNFLIKNKIFFNKKILKNEDQVFMSLSFHYTSNVKVLNLDWYNYRIHGGNISYNNSINKFEHLNGTVEILLNLLKLYKKKKNIFTKKMIEDNIHYFFTAIYLFQNDKIIKKQNIKKTLARINFFLKRKFTQKKICSIFNNNFKNLNISQKDNILLYCAFECSLPILKFIRNKKIKIKTVFDSNKRLENSYFEKIKVRHYKRCNDFISKNKKNLLLITHPEKKVYLIIKKNVDFITKNKIETKHISFKNIFKF